MKCSEILLEAWMHEDTIETQLYGTCHFSASGHIPASVAFSPRRVHESPECSATFLLRQRLVQCEHINQERLRWNLAFAL